MSLSLLDLVSTPIGLLNSLGLEVSAGLSSEDPMGRRPSEPYQVFLTLYNPEGIFARRMSLGEIPPQRRRFFPLSPASQGMFPGANHLAVIHRIPSRFLADGRTPEEPREIDPAEADFSMFRGVVQYAYPGGSSGSVIYETPHGLNTPRSAGRPSPKTLTLTSQVAVSDTMETCLALLHYSVDPRRTAPLQYHYAFFAPDGKLAAEGSVLCQPFTVTLLKAKEILAPAELRRATDPADGIACFGFVGFAEQGVVMPVILSLNPSSRAVSVEHTHPAQSYTCPYRPEEKHQLKNQAIQQWKQQLSSLEPVPARS